MKKLEFYKLQASGNDFILIDTRYETLDTRLNYKNFAKEYCQRKVGIGADGLLVIEPSKRALFKMRIFNPDGSEPEMCGNGARCAALWARMKSPVASYQSAVVKFETKAGIIESKVSNAKVKIKVTDPLGLKLNLPLKISGRKIRVNFINTGVPHTVIFVEGLDKIDVEKIGRQIRFHKKFSPAGTNVNFAEILKDNLINIRTYERGVEAETLACGTGVVASAIITACRLKAPQSRHKIKVLTRGGEILEVYFNKDKDKDKISDVWLEGKAYCVYKGTMRC